MIEQLVLVETQDQARELLAGGSGVQLLAGGTDFVPMYVDDDSIARVVLDIRRLTHLSGIDDDGGHVTVGALTPLNQVEVLDQPWLGALRDGAGNIGSRQTRVRGTIGGNICRASPSGDTLAAVMVLDAQLSVDGSAGKRTVGARDFFVGPGTTVLADDELLESVTIETRRGASAYARSTVRQSMDLATVGVAVAIEAGQDGTKRISTAVSGAAPTPLLATTAHPAGDRAADLDALEQQIQDVISPIDDVRGSAWYRRRLVRPLLDEALESAYQRLAE